MSCYIGPDIKATYWSCSNTSVALAQSLSTRYGICSCISVWFSSYTLAHKNTLERVIKAEIISYPLATLKDLYSNHCGTRSILQNSTHTGHWEVKLLCSGRRYRLLRGGPTDTETVFTIR